MKKLISVIVIALLLCTMITIESPADNTYAWGTRVVFRVSVNNSDTSSNVTGGTFRVTNNKTGEYYDFILIPNTANNSTYYENEVPGWESLQVGDTVTVTELSPAPGYISDYYTSLTARLGADGRLEIFDHPERPNEYVRFRFNNWYYYNIYSENTDKEPIAGAVFDILLPDNSVETEESKNGTVNYKVVRLGYIEGTYYVTEVSPPYGYKLSTEERTKSFSFFRPGPGTDVYYLNPADGTWTNEPHMIKIIKQDGDGKGLAGAEFKIAGTGEDGVYKEKTVITDSGGEAIYSLATWRNGTYAITETVPPSGYKLNDSKPQEFTLDGNDLSQDEFLFTNEQHVVQIRKTSEDGKPLSGAVFEITMEYCIHGQIPEDGGEDEPGQEDPEQDAGEEPEQEDSEQDDGEKPEQSDVSAERECVDCDFEPLTVTVVNGVYNLPLSDWNNGKYTVTEVVSPKGYAIDPEPQDFILNGDELSKESLEFVNSPLEVHIEKVCADTQQTLTTTQFNIKGGDVDIDIVAEDGTFELSLAGWEDGKYTVTEIVPPNGYKLDSDPQEFELVLGTVTTDSMVFTNHMEDAPEIAVPEPDVPEWDVPDWDIPRTGREEINILNWIIPLMVALSIGAAVLRMRIVRKRRGEKP